MKEEYDVIILGGGINGCAVARNLSMAGKRVCLIERFTVGCGTSSNSSKLIHGGLRYLETGRFSLVKESLHDRKRLLNLFPDLIKMVPFYLPVYSDSMRPWWMIRTGLKLYDGLSSQSEYHHYQIDSKEFEHRFISIKSNGLRRVYVYYDGKTDDLALTRMIVKDAEKSGCSLRENCNILLIQRDSKMIRVLYREKDEDHEILAPVLINCTGPWIDEVNNKYKLPHNYKIKKISGIHIIINGLLVPDCMFLQTRNRRIFFMIPWLDDKTIVGTTERNEQSPCDEVIIQDEDIRYILDCANLYLRKPIDETDIINTYIGIRPLVVKKNEESDTTKMNREYKIDLIKEGNTKIINVYGGKLTTCLTLAEKVVANI